MSWRAANVAVVPPGLRQARERATQPLAAIEEIDRSTLLHRSRRSKLAADGTMTGPSRRVADLAMPNFCFTFLGPPGVLGPGSAAGS
jgi:hypothetical protein